MRSIDEVLAALQGSRFRRRFALGRRERALLERHGMDQVIEHGRARLRERLVPAEPSNDGQQTPTRGHPIFIAQHATATCCRGCLAKWHHIERGRPLSEPELDYVLTVLRRWLERAMPQAPVKPRQHGLFDIW